MMSVNRESLLKQYRRVRRASLAMCELLAAEDFRAQPTTEVSPPWWNLGHTSWFFSQNIVKPFGGELLEEDRVVEYALNSYYVTLGPRVPQSQRGWLTRPMTKEIYHYRDLVDTRVQQLIQTVPESKLEEFAFVLTVGLNHEEQHQELFYTEIKYILAQNPPALRTAYRPCSQRLESVRHQDTLISFQGGLYEFGNVEGGWCFDNELAIHKYYLNDFALQNRLVTNGEYLEFMEDGGYAKQLLWLDNGWRKAQQAVWQAPLYWERVDGEWFLWTLNGMWRVDPDEPVCHIGFYEADAFARWTSETYKAWEGARLPTEREWEHAARVSGGTAPNGNFLDTKRLHPAPAPSDAGLVQMFGDVWEWTASYYEPYPGYKPFLGVLAEYNGKFMDNQRVLHGGSCVTERHHIRRSYRNFWAPETRFQFSGLRLAKDL